MMLVIHIPSEGNGGKPRRALASLQHFKEFAFRTPAGSFVKTPITMVAITDRNGDLHCPQHTMSSPDQLRWIANVEIGANAPELADELIEFADRLEANMKGEPRPRPIALTTDICGYTVWPYTEHNRCMLRKKDHPEYHKDDRDREFDNVTYLKGERG